MLTAESESAKNMGVPFEISKLSTFAPYGGSGGCLILGPLNSFQKYLACIFLFFYPIALSRDSTPFRGFLFIQYIHVYILDVYTHYVHICVCACMLAHAFVNPNESKENTNTRL